MCPKNAMAASVWDFNVCTDVDAHDCTLGLHGHCKRVCTWSWLGERNPLPHLGPEPTSVLHLAFPLDSLQTELFLPLKKFYMLLFAGSVYLFWGVGGWGEVLWSAFSTETLSKSTEKMCVPAIHLCWAWSEADAAPVCRGSSTLTGHPASAAAQHGRWTSVCFSNCAGSDQCKTEQ